MDFGPFLAHWRDNKNCSFQTIRSYRNDLKLFEAFLHDKSISRLTQVDHGVINDYIQHMKQKANTRFGRTGLADSSIARRLAAVSGYFEYVRATTNPKMRNPLRDLTRRWKKNNDPKPVDSAILDQLIEGISNRRDRVLISLFLATGLRVSEMCQLNRGTIRFDVETNPNGDEQVGGSGEVTGKGNKRRTFFVDEETLQLYAEYLATRTDDNPALFLSERKQRISVRAIQYTLAAWCRKLGLAHINIHRLRHSYGSRLASANISSMVLMKLMGHDSYTTTQNYVKLHDTTLARGYFAAVEYLKR
jgi:site-specific recombinase XerD